MNAIHALIQIREPPFTADVWKGSFCKHPLLNPSTLPASTSPIHSCVSPLQHFSVLSNDVCNTSMTGVAHMRSVGAQQICPRLLIADASWPIGRWMDLVFFSMTFSKL